MAIANGAFVKLLSSLIVVCTLIEIILLCSDYGLIPVARLRTLAYDYGGFWPGLLENWLPNYTGQPWLMFFTYGFLHASPAHLFVNMITLWSLGRAVIQRVGTGGVAMLYLGSMLGGAGGFALLASELRPMVGASGALFGLAGGLLAWTYVDLFNSDRRLWPVLRAVGMLALLNVVLWWAMSGQLAWETHLGGFVIGWLMALLIDPRALPFEDDE